MEEGGLCSEEGLLPSRDVGGVRSSPLKLPRLEESKPRDWGSALLREQSPSFSFELARAQISVSLSTLPTANYFPLAKSVVSFSASKRRHTQKSPTNYKAPHVLG